MGAGFLLWHLNLVRMGTTTNELSKWQDLKYHLKKEGKRGQQKIKELCNIYNNGFVENYKEVFAPIDVHKLPKSATKKVALEEKEKNEVMPADGQPEKRPEEKKAE